MNTTNKPAEIQLDNRGTDKRSEASIMEQDMNGLSDFTLSQRMAICFAAGVIGALAVVIFSHILFAAGLSAELRGKAPGSLKSPDIYKPPFWGGLWGIPFCLLLKTAWETPD